MDNNQDKEIREILERHSESFDVPESLEDDIMKDVTAVEAKKDASLNLKNILIFAAIAGVLVLIALASQLYFPEAIWLLKAKFIVTCVLVAYGLYQLITWLPIFLEKYFTRAK
jgi:hypothetical protein